MSSLFASALDAMWSGSLPDLSGKSDTGPEDIIDTLSGVEAVDLRKHEAARMSPANLAAAAEFASKQKLGQLFSSLLWTRDPQVAAALLRRTARDGGHRTATPEAVEVLACPANRPAPALDVQVEAALTGGDLLAFLEVEPNRRYANQVVVAVTSYRALTAQEQSWLLSRRAVSTLDAPRDVHASAITVDGLNTFVESFPVAAALAYALDAGRQTLSHDVLRSFAAAHMPDPGSAHSPGAALELAASCAVLPGGLALLDPFLSEADLTLSDNGAGRAAWSWHPRTFHPPVSQRVLDGPVHVVQRWARQRGRVPAAALTWAEQVWHATGSAPSAAALSDLLDDYPEALGLAVSQGCTHNDSLHWTIARAASALEAGGAFNATLPPPTWVGVPGRDRLAATIVEVGSVDLARWALAARLLDPVDLAGGAVPGVGMAPADLARALRGLCLSPVKLADLLVGWPDMVDDVMAAAGTVGLLHATSTAGGSAALAPVARWCSQRFATDAQRRRLLDELAAFGDGQTEPWIGGALDTTVPLSSLLD